MGPRETRARDETLLETAVYGEPMAVIVGRLADALEEALTRLEENVARDDTIEACKRLRAVLTEADR